MFISPTRTIHWICVYPAICMTPFECHRLKLTGRCPNPLVPFVLPRTGDIFVQQTHPKTNPWFQVPTSKDQPLIAHILVAIVPACAALHAVLRLKPPKDMLSRVRDQRPSHNNSAWITSSVAVSRVKLMYYRAFARLYGVVGGYSSRVMVNSTWTRGHIAALWKRSPPPTVVFPPCDTSELEVKQPMLQGLALPSLTDSWVSDLGYCCSRHAIN